MNGKNNRLREGVSRAAWAYLFLYLDINLGTVSILPAFVGYLLFYEAIGYLEGERRDLALLRPLCVLLGLWAGAGWLLSWMGQDLEGLLYPLDLVIQAAQLYFHFQLFTDFAALAGRYQDQGDGLEWRLLRLRTVQVVATTAILVIVCLRPAGNSWEGWVAVGLVLLNTVVAVLLMSGLFRLRSCLEGAESEP